MIVEVRKAVEVDAARMATKRGTAEDLDRVAVFRQLLEIEGVTSNCARISIRSFTTPLPLPPKTCFPAAWCSSCTVYCTTTSDYRIR